MSTLPSLFRSPGISVVVGDWARVKTGNRAYTYKVISTKTRMRFITKFKYTKKCDIFEL